MNVRTMKPANHTLKVLSVEPGSEKTNNMIFVHRQNEALSKRGVICRSLAIAHAKSLSDFMGHLLLLRRELKEFQPLIIHAQYGSYTAFLCSLFSFNRSFVVTFRGSDLNLNANISNTNILRGILGYLLSQISAVFACRIVCVSEGLKKRIWLGKSKTKIIPDGVDLDSFLPGSLSEARSMLGITENARVLLFNAGYNPKIKRRDLSDQVAHILKQRIEGFRYIVMEGQVSSDEVPFYLQASDCLLVTSDSEGSPCIVKEALACGLPIVSVDVGDVVQMTKGVSQCWVVEREVAELAECVEEAILLRKRSNGREFRHRYDMVSSMDRLIGCYKSLQSRS